MYVEENNLGFHSKLLLLYLHPKSVVVLGFVFGLSSVYCCESISSSFKSLALHKTHILLAHIHIRSSATFAVCIDQWFLTKQN